MFSHTTSGLPSWLNKDLVRFLMPARQDITDKKYLK